MTTSTRRIVKIVLYVAERKDWSVWSPLTRIRPSTDKDTVVRKLKAYCEERRRSYGSLRNGYRVVPYRQEPAKAEGVVSS